MKKNNIVVTVAGFVGKNLIKKLLSKTNYNIIAQMIIHLDQKIIILKIKNKIFQWTYKRN